MGIFSKIFGSSNSEQENYLKIGILKYKNKEYKDALRYFSNGIKSESNHYLLYKYRANVFEDMKDYKNAISEYQKANNLFEHHTHYYGLGFCYMQINENENALSAYDKAIRLKENNLLEKGETELRDGIPISVGIEVLYNNRANTKLKLRDFESALADVNKSLRINPNYSKALTTKSLIESMFGLSMLTNQTEQGSKNRIEFIKQVMEFANSSKAVKMQGNLRLRDSFFLDLAEKLSKLGSISYNQVLSISIKYAEEMFHEFKIKAGFIDNFNKGYILYELSCTLSKIYPGENTNEIFKDLLNRMDIL